MSTELTAKVCHEVNRVLTEFVKDVPVQASWEASSEDMRTSCISGVLLVQNTPNITAADLHAEWMKQRLEAGWTCGLIKSDTHKTHPALSPYEELPEGTKLKDKVFRAIVKAMVSGEE